MTHRFDPARMERLLDPARREWMDPDRVLSYIEPEQCQGVADIGCGPGFFTLEIARRLPPDGVVYGVDLSEEMLARLKERAQEAGLANVQAVLAEEDDEFPIQSATCDAALLVNMYHECDPASNFLHELRRLVKPGGRVLLVDWRPEPTPMGPPMEERLDPADVTEEFTVSGFALEREVEVGPYSYGLLFRRPVAG